MTAYHFIEIGTSDFDTVAQTVGNDAKGISVEPIRMYLDRVPSKANCTKVCAAISDTEGEVEVFYVKPEEIEKHNLPWWVRGSNSIIDMHPNVKRILDERKIPLEQVVTTETVKTMRLKTLIDEFNVSSLELLKIDTEGHDAKILLDYFNCCINDNYPEPKSIVFEHRADEFDYGEEYNKVLSIAQSLNYDIQEYIADTVLKKRSIT